MVLWRSKKMSENWGNYGGRKTGQWKGWYRQEGTQTAHLQRTRIRLVSPFSSLTLDTRKKTLETAFKDLKENNFQPGNWESYTQLSTTAKQIYFQAQRTQIIYLSCTLSWEFTWGCALEKRNKSREEDMCWGRHWI